MFLPDMFPDDRDEEIKLSRPGKGRHTAEYKAAASKQHRRKRSAKTGRINLAAKRIAADRRSQWKRFAC